MNPITIHLIVSLIYIFSTIPSIHCKKATPRQKLTSFAKVKANGTDTDTSHFRTTTTRAPIYDCDFKFQPSVRIQKRGWLYVTIKNPASKSITYGHYLECMTVEIMKESASSSEGSLLPPGGKMRASYMLRISIAYYKDHPDVTEHKCTFSKWPIINGKKGNSENCYIKIQTETSGLFSRGCPKDDNDVVKIDMTRKTNELIVEHHGETTSFSANTTCEPELGLVLHGSIYNTLNSNSSWTIPLFPNCSDLLDIDYSGVCRITVYHICTGKKIADYSYPYYEGKTEECHAQVDKETSYFVLLYFRGANKVVFLLSMSLALCTVITICGKMAYIFHLQGDAKRGWPIFVVEMKKTFEFCSCMCFGICKTTDYEPVAKDDKEENDKEEGDKDEDEDEEDEED
ncbi:uncharacterized protein [Clytia hemisphaerica]|uniref:Cnidarian restricted protein n=1 Tax=Clytia hemisphaerica TaxID=252671 RepID=A0A7M6DQF6_9CNID|eukprot:TCONS_00055106-protein